jgi:hypothetical protein
MTEPTRDFTVEATDANKGRFCVQKGARPVTGKYTLDH